MTTNAAKARRDVPVQNGHDDNGLGEMTGAVRTTAAGMVVVTPADPRDDAQVTFPDGRILAAPVGTPLEAYFKAWQKDHENDAVVGAVVDNRLRELTYPVTRDVSAAPVTMDSSDGGRIYRRSLVFLLTTAAAELHPEAQVVIDHSLPGAAFFCRLRGRPNFSAAELADLEAHMRAIAEADAPIRRKSVPLDEALGLFEARGDDDKLRLMENRAKNYLVLYTLRDNADYFYGYMVPSTGYLKLFELHLVEESGGFIMQYPRAESSDRILPYTPSVQIARVFDQSARWLERLGVEDIGHLNRAVQSDRVRELILVAEALHEQHIAEIASAIKWRHADGVRLVLIAGPSSSGKTTFSKRLAVQLLAQGLRPFPLGLDHYFVDREATPRDAAGDYDFENIGALNLPLFNAQLVALTSGQPVTLPHFNFVTGRSEQGPQVQLTGEHVLLIEGIHGLNPALVPDVPPERIFRVYVSALTQLNIDRHNRVPTTDVRLLRRIVRDATYRGYTASDTIQRWASVRSGEKAWIFPYQENADVMFNSALMYELAVLKPKAEPLLLQVDHESPQYIEAKRLLSFLRWVRPASDEFVPQNSLLREFVGGCVLENYSPESD